MSQSEEEQNIPDRDTCQKLTEQFAEITGTDVACAQFYLQDRCWDLERSVNAFFEASQKGGVSVLNDCDAPGIVVNVDKKMAKKLEQSQPTIIPPSKFSIISWNLDGLEERNLKKRTKAVCKIITMQKPDVIFFQEVIPETFTYLEDRLPEYMCIAGNTEGYFSATLLRRFTIYFDGHEIVTYPGSLMMRNLLSVEAHIGSLKLKLLNTHLESTAEHAAERVRQLKTGFKMVQEFPENYTVVYGGDLNMRDKEVELAGGIPPGMVDLWAACGARQTCQYTWDMVRNSNKEIASRFKPRCRFDRLYLRHAHPRRVVPAHFGLVGIEKVAGTQSFPSDHWGIQAFFDISDQ
ncbi:tyrosyl-DNA phosphodiesterase 2-like [Bacillus rossius redtenbacheri]|uniref:tyrosyl-DNA phosphodiesterase 2-like n=1 Tax=Bacillus rossius redtenbacheri TaxID=93214 RepID=UPI002FDD146E